MLIHSSQVPMLAVFQENKAPTKISPKYTDYTDIFSLDLAIELPKNSGINNYANEIV